MYGKLPEMNKILQARCQMIQELSHRDLKDRQYSKHPGKMKLLASSQKGRDQQWPPHKPGVDFFSCNFVCIDIRTHLHQSLGIVASPLFEATTMWESTEVWEERSGSNSRNHAHEKLQ
jgi:hypothetical protein